MENLLGLHEISDGVGEIEVEVMAEAFEAFDHGGGGAFEVAVPAFDMAEFFFAFFESGAGFADGGLRFGEVIAEAREFGAEEFLFGLAEDFLALAHLTFPKESLVMLEPHSGAADIVADIIDGAFGFTEEKDQSGAEGFEGIDGRDAGLEGHGLALVEIFFDALGFAQKVGGMFFGDLDKLFEDLHGVKEFLAKAFGLLILP